MAKKQEAKAGFELSMGSTDGKIGVEATRDYHNSHLGFFRKGERAMVDGETMKQVIADHGKDSPLKPVEFTEEEKAALDEVEAKAVKSPETKALGSPETK